MGGSGWVVDRVCRLGGVGFMWGLVGGEWAGGVVWGASLWAGGGGGVGVRVCVRWWGGEGVMGLGIGGRVLGADLGFGVFVLFGSV